MVKDLIDLGIVGTDKTDTASTKGSAVDTTYVGIAQSHEEDFDLDDGMPELSDEELEIELHFNKKGAELATLEGEYSRATTPNQKRSLKAKINKLKKDAGSK